MKVELNKGLFQPKYPYLARHRDCGYLALIGESYVIALTGTPTVNAGAIWRSDIGKGSEQYYEPLMPGEVVTLENE